MYAKAGWFVDMIPGMIEELDPENGGVNLNDMNPELIT